MPHNFAHFTNDMVPFINQLQAGEITADQFRQAMQNVETQQQDPLDMGTGTGALSSIDQNTSTNAMDPNVPEPVAEDLGPHGSPQPLPTQVFSSLGSAEQGEEYETFSDIIRQSAEDSGLNTDRKQLNRVTFSDPDTGQSYTYNFGKGEFEGIAPSGAIRNANLVAAQTGQDFREISGLSGLVPVSGLYEGEDDYFRFNISEEFQDPSKYDYSGALGQSPSEALAYAKELAKDDKSDNDLFYTYEGRTYVDVSGTGSGIPVGATNITRDPTQLDLGGEGQLVAKDDPKTYTSPVLDKTFQGYVASGTSLDSEGKVVTGQPDATDSFFESIGTNVPYDLGAAFGFDDNQNFVLSSPPSNRFNLEPFFNQAESQGLEPFVKSQQRDTLQMIKDGNFFTALAGGGTVDGDFISIDEMYPTATGVGGLNLVLDKLQGQGQFDDGLGIDPSFQLDAFDNDSDSQVSSITGDDEGTDADPDGDEDPDADPETPEATDPFTVRAFKGGGLGPYATNYMFQRFGYKPQQTIDLNLTYDPVEKLYFFEDGSPVDPKFLENMQLTKLDEDGNVVYDDEDNPVTMPRVVVNDDEETTSEDE
jgi:hypothetical protein